MVNLYRVGLFTCWVSAIGFKERVYPPIMGLSWRNLPLTSYSGAEALAKAVVLRPSVFLFSPGIEVKFHKPALQRAVEEGDFPGGFQSEKFQRFQVG